MIFSLIPLPNTRSILFSKFFPVLKMRFFLPDLIKSKMRVMNPLFPIDNQNLHGNRVRATSTKLDLDAASKLLSTYRWLRSRSIWVKIRAQIGRKGVTNGDLARWDEEEPDTWPDRETNVPWALNHCLLSLLSFIKKLVTERLS